MVGVIGRELAVLLANLCLVRKRNIMIYGTVPTWDKSSFTFVRVHFAHDPQQEVDLSLNRMSGAGVAALAASLADPTSGVTSLCLAQNGIGRRGGEHLAKMLSGGARDGDVEWGHVRT